MTSTVLRRARANFKTATASLARSSLYGPHGLVRIREMAMTHSWRRPQIHITGALLLAAAFGAACGDPVDEKPIEETDGPGACVPTRQYFNDEVWNPFMSTTCFACHNAQGIAASSDLVLQSPNQTGFLDANLAIVGDVAAFERDGLSILLLKPSAQINHGGGTVIETDGPEYKALEELVRQLRNPVVCENTGDDPFVGVNLLDNAGTYRKATLSLGGRLPTAEEHSLVSSDSAADLDAALDGLLEEEAFYVRLKEIYNDLFLTDKYRNGRRGTELIDRSRFPTALAYEADFPPQADRTTEQNTQFQRIEARTNAGVSQEVLELVAYIARNNKSWTELVTADYMMVNPFSAKSYGVDDIVEFADAEDIREFKPVSIPGYEHAGVLSDPMWLNRFPTTTTNRNRHRARMVLKHFLATDILRIADRPLDSAAIAGLNPTLNDRTCTVCHANIDPIAGTFQNWNDTGAYKPPTDGWFGDMFQPGFKDETLPFEDRLRATNFLGERIAADPLFALATVHTLYKGLTGRDPVGAPTDPSDPAFASKDRAYTAQDAVLQDIAAAFIDAEFDIKVAVKGLITSPYFRAASAQDALLSTDNAAFLASLGTAQFLTPELLDRKIEAVTGYPWKRSGTDPGRLLLRDDEYRIYYGGIDSDSITTRITAPNGLMASVASRMSLEMSCRVGPRDFVELPENRRFFPLVEASFEPEDENGFAIPAAEEAIKHNIVHMFARVLDQRVGLEDEELLAAYDLWRAVWKDGKAKILAGQELADLNPSCRVERDYFTNVDLEESKRLRRDPNFTVRAWSAVLAYLLSDARFLHD